jgi:hypothetical protein
VQVGGDDGIEALRLPRHPHRHGVDQRGRDCASVKA